MNAPVTPTASVLAQTVYAAYLARVALCVETCAAGDEADFLTRAAPLDLRQVAYLVDRLAVPAHALLGDDDGLGWPLMAARVEFLVGRAPRFAWVDEPDTGTPALMTVLRDASGGQDVVAIGLRDDFMATLDGVAMLGGQDLEDEPVTVHAGPLEWLRAGRRGLVLLDRGRCLGALRGKRGIVVSDVQAGDDLLCALKPRLPKILVEA